MEKKVAVIHTSLVSVSDLKDLFKEIMPSVNMYNIVDDSLLAEVLKNGGVTSQVIRRICAYAIEAEAMGVDLILNQCSSVGEAVDVARKSLKIPYLKIDEPMAEEAVKIGGRLSVIATLQTTLGPSIRLIESTASALNKKVYIRSCLVEGAFDVLVNEGNKEKHNEMVLEKIITEADKADAVILAQGSMISLLPQLNGIQKPILTSPRSGVMRVRERLDL
jgi:Asp/Glu/hydantoin racemase